MRIAAVQLDIAWEDKGESLARAKRLIEAVRIERGDLVVLPEMFSTGFSMEVERIAEGEAKPAERFLAETAVRYGCFTLGGVVNLSRDGRGRNEAVAFGPDGCLIARYCKLHPFSFAGETRFYEPGELVVTFDWGQAKVAPFVCYDLRFPEAFRRAVRSGATVFAVIANWPAARAHHWRALLIARAIENQAYVVGVNRCGRDPKLDYAGETRIIGPKGETLAEAAGEQAVIATEIDLADLEHYRRKFPALRDMREEFFPQQSR